MVSAEDIDDVLRDYFNGDYEGGEIHPKLWELTRKTITSAVDEGFKKIEYNDDSIAVINELKTNAAVFSAFKNHIQSEEIAQLLVDEKGKRRSWTEFRAEAEKIDKAYNQNWLRSEYNFAVRAARSAQQWQEFLRTADVYPNIEYLKSRSASPREAHKKFYGLIRPIDDPIWDRIMPPSEWGCLCSVRKSDAEVTDVDFDLPEPIPGLTVNPGKSRQLFNPDHPYVANTPTRARKGVQKQLNAMNSGVDEYSTLKVGKKSVKVHFKADPKNLLENKDFAVLIAKKLKTASTLPEFSYANGAKNPGMIIGKLVGSRVKMTGTKVRSFLSNSFDKKLQSNGQLNGFKQCFIAIDFNGKLNIDNAQLAASQLSPKLMEYKTVKYVILRNENKMIKLQNKGQSSSDILKTIKEKLV